MRIISARGNENWLVTQLLNNNNFIMTLKSALYSVQRTYKLQYAFSLKMFIKLYFWNFQNCVQ